MTTEILSESIKLESMKRKPLRKSGRILMAIRDMKKRELVKAAREASYSHYSDENVRLRNQIYDLDAKIRAYFVKEDLKKTTLELFTPEQMLDKTNERTRVEFKQFGRVYQAVFIGSMDAAKIALAHRRSAIFHWAHSYRVLEERIPGMWEEMKEI